MLKHSSYIYAYVYSKFLKHLYVLSSIREVLNYDIGQYSLANGGVGNIRSDQTVNLAQSNHFKIFKER